MNDTMVPCLLSIVVPCYNSADLLIKTLRKYEGKDYCFVEFVIVDDCSTDNSFEIIKSFSTESNLNVIYFKNFKNSGPGISRNIAIEHCNGKYITFLDSDDYLDSSFFQDILEVLDSDLDMIFFDARIVSKNKRECYLNSVNLNKSSSDLFSKEDYLVFSRGAPWGKIYKKSVITENRILFLPQKRCEDIGFVKTAISKSNSFAYLRKPYYFYFQRVGSLMHSPKLRNPQYAQNAFNYIFSNIDSKYKKEIEAIFIIELLYSTGCSTLFSFKKKEWKQYIDNLEARYPDYLSNPYYSFYSKRIKMFVNVIHARRYYFLKLLTLAQRFFKKVVR